MDAKKDFWKDWIVCDFVAFGEEEKLRYAKEESYNKEKYKAARLEKLTGELRNLAYKDAVAESRDRRRIAKEMDDLLGQKLVLAGMKIGVLAKSSPELEASLNEIQSLLRDLSKQARTISGELCSPVLYDIGLEAAIGELASQTQEKFGIECRMIEGGQTRQIDEDLKGLLFKCTHELLKNVIKHARAEHIVVRMSYQDNIVFIAVDDDGFGFDARILANDSNKSTGVGLFGMRERLRMVGGEVDVRSDLCVGTSITISCPVQKK